MSKYFDQHLQLIYKIMLAIIITLKSFNVFIMINISITSMSTIRTQRPPLVLLIVTPTFPQKLQVYLLCWAISIFLTIFLSEAPYLVPYLPVIPTFLVLLAWMDTNTIIITVTNTANDKLTFLTIPYK